jgi:hypothetical protein
VRTKSSANDDATVAVAGRRSTEIALISPAWTSGSKCAGIAFTSQLGNRSQAVPRHQTRRNTSRDPRTVERRRRRTADIDEFRVQARHQRRIVGGGIAETKTPATRGRWRRAPRR